MGPMWGAKSDQRIPRMHNFGHSTLYYSHVEICTNSHDIQTSRQCNVSTYDVYARHHRFEGISPSKS